MQCRMALWSQTQLSCCVWFCSCCCHATRGVTGAVMAVLRCGRSRHATCSVTVTVVVLYSAIVAVAPQVVSQSRLSRHVLRLLLPCRAWCRGCCCQAALCHGHGRHAACGVTIAVVAPVFTPCMVPQALSPHHAWCHRCSHHAAHGAAGIVIAVHVVLQVLSLRHAWCCGCCRRTVWSWWPCRVWCHSRYCRGV
jgi:hypothetical protein